MNGWINSLVDESVQCWGCPVFDRLFQIISAAAADVYRQFTLFCILIFCIILVFYIANAVWKNIKDGAADPFYKKTIQPILISGVFVFSLLGLGVYLPRFITTVTFEPVASITLGYTQSLINLDTETIEKKVTYQPAPMADDGFYRPQLRDKIILIMKTTITQFQSYMKLGIAVMDKAFSWNAILGIGMFLKHIMMFAMGLFLVYQFFKLFIKFCFYFVDVIVAMTFFAFMFPISVVLYAFKDADSAPGWMKTLGTNITAKHFKDVIASIIGLAAAVLTYTVIMVIIAKFFSHSGTSASELMKMITSGEVFAGALSDDNLATMTLSGCIVLVYVVNFLADKVKEVAEEVLKAFDAADALNANKLGDQMGEDALKVTGNIIKAVTDIGKTVIAGENQKPEKKEDKKEEKK